jgi:hypothetical protein
VETLSNGFESLKALIIASLMVVAFSFASSCSRPLTDEKLIDEFNRNKALFERLRILSVANNLDCPYASDPDICVPKSSEEVVAQLKRNTGFADMTVWVRRQQNVEINVPVETIGILATSTHVFGYTYSRSDLTPLVENVGQELVKRQVYKRIDGDWYLFMAN